MADSPIRILVTGTRGKSSLVRLIHCALSASGIRTYSRITGVRPCQLGPSGTREIIRHAGAHVGEMKWWIRTVREKAGAIVLENSAVSPELQPLAGRWLRPGLVVLTNVLADHQEVWGPLPDHAARVLVRGIPVGSRVVLPGELAAAKAVGQRLAGNGCDLIPVSLDPDPPGAPWGVRAANQALALGAAAALGLDAGICSRAMAALAPDAHDFCVRPFGNGVMAMAFTANDLASTRHLFDSLGWPASTTRLLFNHRRDRPGRMASFARWMAAASWQGVDIIGDRPVRAGRLVPGARYLPVKTLDDLAGRIRPGEKIFGCGNVAGLPLAMAGGPLPGPGDPNP